MIHYYCRDEPVNHNVVTITIKDILTELQMRGGTGDNSKNIFLFLYEKTYAVTPHQKYLLQELHFFLMDREIPQLSLLPLLIWRTM